jgi:hypothetical protein
MPNLDNIESPILIGGAGRSGTTWVVDNLGRHPQVQGLVETGLAYGIYREVYQTWWTERFLLRECAGDEAKRESRTIEAIHQSLTAMFPSRRERWAMKIIWGVESTWGVPLAFWRKCFPGARYIHCTRNPLAAIPSMRGYLGKFSNMDTITACESAFIKGNRDMLELASQGVPCFRLRLEDVAHDPLAVWAELCRFCCLPEADLPAAEISQPRNARSNVAEAAPEEPLTWGGLSSATLAMARQLGYEVPEDCQGKQEAPAPSQPSVEELTTKTAQLADENIELRRQLLRLRRSQDEQASPREPPTEEQQP